MYQHFSGNGSKSEPCHAARYCSECGHELYADENLVCQECLETDNEDGELDD